MRWTCSTPFVSIDSGIASSIPVQNDLQAARIPRVPLARSVTSGPKMQSASIRILSGDIGGTKTRLAVIAVAGTRLHLEREHNYASRDYAAFEELLGEFLQGSDTPERAAFGIAGPVQGRAAQTTNLPWRIDADALQARFGFERCSLLNDLEATAIGLPALNKEDLLTLHAGAPNDAGIGTGGNAAVIAAGTGLGEAGLFWDGQRYRPFATEGGHASFSPKDDLEVALSVSYTHLTL